MPSSAVFAVALAAAAAVAAVTVPPAAAATTTAAPEQADGAAPPASASRDVSPRPSHIMVRPPPRQVEEASAAPAPAPVPAPVLLPVRPAHLGPPPPPGTISFPSERPRPLQQADERLDVEQEVWSWDSLREGCGDTKNCLGNPPNCLTDGTPCNILVTEQVMKHTDPQASPSPEFTFRMRATDAKWVAVGLGQTKLMYDTSVIECVVNAAGNVETYLSYTPPAKRGCIRTGTTSALRLINGRNMDGGLFCEVVRLNHTRSNNIDWFLDEYPFFLQAASGKAVTDTAITYHTPNFRVASAQSTRLDSYGTLGAVSNWPMRLHGALMVLAWMCAATAGSLAARYFKAAWGKATICGKAMWFAWHRLLMILTVVLHLAAVIAALVFLEGWSSSSGVHGILGGITTGLALIQGAAGLLRPGPDDKYRPIFNWGHRVQGFLTHMIAIITIFFAVSLPNARLPSWTYAVLAVYVVFYVALHALHSVGPAYRLQFTARHSNQLAQFDIMYMNGKRSRMLTEVKSYYFLIVFFGSAVFAIIMLVLVVIGPGDSE
ncbi:Putative ferric-chelate reductase 1-like protein [Frankliniella fusca]|uniref:Ferric-chelate reductase 1-like protein n=1 Tax=Frankliniella fusca TaxID=407009 RepID=A0AAE1LGX1_9NEOP|nr:Putative ferric-chelate reductase 1-like protein [Frankliniella fusca]